MPMRPSDSSDSEEDEWGVSQKRSKKRKMTANKRSKPSEILPKLEEGEISSDDLDDDEDDGLDENLIGGEEDKRKLEKMSEREREEELFKRAERRDAIEARRAVKQKLKEKRDRERAEKASKSKYADSGKKKQSAYSNVFSSDDDALNSDSSDGAGPQGIRSRKLALEKRKEAHSHKFHELIERRRRQAARKQQKQSGSEYEEDDERHSAPNRSAATSSFSDSDGEFTRRKSRLDRGDKRGPKMSDRIFSDASDSSGSSHPGVQTTARRASLSSFSGSQRSSSSSDDDARGRSRSPEKILVTSLDQLSRIRLSRFKLEKWVHMPFFDNLVKGCFVRINIGLCQGVPVYRVAEIVDVVETQKIYDLGDTRTNKGMVVRVGKDQSTFRLAFVSNSEFTEDEFESWLRRIMDANMRPPSLAFVASKAAEIQDAITRPIRDDRVVEQIIQSKRRFQRAPVNFALRKAELIKLREQAEVDADTEAIHRYNMEIEELESQAERIERRRTLGFNAITSINQRNRVLSLQQAEEAIRKESAEALQSTEEDPFTRVHSQPVIVTKNYLEQLRNKRVQSAKQDFDTQDSDRSIVESASTQSLTNQATPNPNCTTARPADSTPASGGGRVSWSLAGEPLRSVSNPHDTLHAIHNFEININLDLDGVAPASSDQQQAGVDTPTKSQPVTGSMGTSNEDNVKVGAGIPNGPGARANRRLLNLQEYKKRMGLI